MSPFEIVLFTIIGFAIVMIFGSAFVSFKEDKEAQEARIIRKEIYLRKRYKMKRN